MIKKKILIVDDELSIRQFLNDVFIAEGFSVLEAANGDEALKILQHESIDVVVMDLRMPGHDGMETLKEFKRINLHTKVIIMTGYATVNTAVEAMKLGAVDYLVKPFENDELVARVKAAISKRKKKQRSQQLSTPGAKAEVFPGIIGNSPVMLEIFKVIKKVAIPNTTVLITGESGTGKSLLGQVIHNLSSRSQFPFVTINCAVLPENLLESELFGHEKGAFTGAVSTKIGKFEMANKGTVFLDEIGTLSLQTQAKLLRVIQEKKFERVGGTQTLEVDVRIIAATNENLEEAVASGQFREDLYYRLNVVSIIMPSLRERTEDIPSLVDFFIERFNHKLGKNIRGISGEAMDLILQYPWPGNIRELENVIERAMILSDDIRINVECLPQHIRNSAKGNLDINMFRAVDISNLDNALGKAEKNILIETLEKTEGHRARAAALLGISRRALQYKLKKYGMLER